MSRTKVLLADDHTLLLEAFKGLLESEFDVVGTVGDGRALVERVRTLRPDVVVVDITMPLMNGLEAARQIHEMSPRPRLIFLTMNPDPAVANEAFQAGALGYLLKTSAASELTTAIRSVARGLKYITPAMKRKLQEEFIKNPSGEKISRALTGRQREVLQLLVEGRPMKEAAAILNVAPRTVAYHKYKMMAQLGLRSSAELIHYAFNNNVIPR